MKRVMKNFVRFGLNLIKAIDGFNQIKLIGERLGFVGLASLLAYIIRTVIRIYVSFITKGLNG